MFVKINKTRIHCKNCHGVKVFQHEPGAAAWQASIIHVSKDFDSVYPIKNLGLYPDIEHPVDKESLCETVQLACPRTVILTGFTCFSKFINTTQYKTNI